MPPLNCVILAAGKGTRMKSKLPKIAHPIMGRPMVRYVVAAARELDPREIVVVTGYESALVEDCLRDDHVKFALQAEQKGTAHALLVAEAQLADGDILVLYGDVPLIKASTLRAFMESFRESEGIAFITTRVDRPDGYGRVIVDADGNILDIVEDSEAAGAVRDVDLINTGICMIRRNLFGLVKSVTPENRKGEYFLTDICKLAQGRGIKVRAHFHPEAGEVLGINTRRELSEAILLVRNAILDRHMARGVTVTDRSAYIEADAQIESDTVISPYCYITGKTHIGSDAIIGPHVIIKDSVIGRGARVEGFAYLDGAHVEDGALVPAFSRITSA
jgi:bifunctional UDP-N-acetylglucosamine pyrophosphorylase/glucosamine-1-phosphate N-acetyltransferase